VKKKTKRTLNIKKKEKKKERPFSKRREKK